MTTTTLLPKSRIGIKKTTINRSVLRELKPEKGIGIEKGSTKDSYLKKLETIRDFFLTKYKNDKDTFRQNLKRRQDEKRRIREEAIEEKENLKKESKSNLLPKFKTPTLLKDIFSSIGNFLLFLAGGIIFNSFGGIETLLKGVSKTLEVIGSTVQLFADAMGQLVNFIDSAYNGYDKMVKQISNITGLSEEQINGFTNKLNKVINGVLIASMIILRSLPGIMRARGRNLGRDMGSSRRGFSQQQNLRNVLRDRRLNSNPSVRRYVQRFGVDAGRKRFGGEAIKNLGAKHSRNVVTNIGRKGIVTVLGKGGTKSLFHFSKRFISPILKRIPIIGAIIDFAFNYFVFKEPLGKAAFKAIGAGLFAALGGLVGGPFAPFTMIGGSILGDVAGGALYDAVFGKMSETGNSQELMAKAVKQQAEDISKKGEYDEITEINNNIIQPIVFA